MILRICLASRPTCYPIRTLSRCLCFYQIYPISYVFLAPFRLKCKRCFQDVQRQPPAENTDCTSHLSQWFHCSNNRGLPDSILSQAWTASKCVSFVFHHRSQGDSKPAAIIAEDDQSEQQQLSPKRTAKNDDDAEFDPEDSAEEQFLGF